MSNIPRLEQKETHSSLLEWFWCGLVAVGNWAQVVVIDLLVAQTRHTTLAEVHDVLRQRSRLIRKQVLHLVAKTRSNHDTWSVKTRYWRVRDRSHYLSQLFVNVGCVGFGRFVNAFVIHLKIPLEKQLSTEFHELCARKADTKHEATSSLKIRKSLLNYSAKILH